jgi:heme exporter protein B
MLKQALWLFNKDLTSELRTRYAINALGMFIVVTISVILFAIGQEKISTALAGGLLWVVIFFTAMSGLSRAFVSEEERGTTLLLQLVATPQVVLTGKLFYNLILVFAMNMVILVIYSALFDAFILKNVFIFFFSFILGNTGLAFASTIIASIIAKANSKGTLYPVLAFPILLPLLLMLVEITKRCSTGVSFDEISPEFFALISYNVVIATASFMLFDFIWKE